MKEARGDTPQRASFILRKITKLQRFSRSYRGLIHSKTKSHESNLPWWFFSVLLVVSCFVCSLIPGQDSVPSFTKLDLSDTKKKPSTDFP
jgi:hypothetical protein